MLIPLTNANGEILKNASGQVLGTTLVEAGAIAVYSLRKLADGHPHALQISINGTLHDIAFGEEGHEAIRAATNDFADVAKVATWYDQSGNGYHAVSATNQPEYLPIDRSLRFAGDAMQTPIVDGPFAGEFALFHRAFVFGPAEQSSNNPKLAGNTNGLAGGGLQINLRGLNNLGKDGIFIQAISSSGGQLAAMGVANNVVDRWQTVCFNQSGADMELYIDGALDNKRSWDYDLTTSPGQFHIGGNGRGSNNGRFDVAEMIVFDRAISAATIAHLAVF